MDAPVCHSESTQITQEDFIPNNRIGFDESVIPPSAKLEKKK